MKNQMDKKDFEQARPFVVGVVALMFEMRMGMTLGADKAFDYAELFVAEFEKRNGLTK